MASEYYTHTTFPATSSFGSSAQMRAELDSIDAGFAKLPTLSGNAGKFVLVNASANGQAVASTLSESGSTVTASTNLSVGAALSVGGATTLSSTLAVAGVATLTANPVLSSGTANGVVYLNGSKVATSGSALTFDGANFATTGSVTLENARYYQSKTPGGATVRMLGINAGNIAYVGPIDSGPAESIINASSSVLNTQFYAAGTEQMRLTSTGLGIGTSSPSFFTSGASGGVATRFSGGAAIINAVAGDASSTSNVGLYSGASSSDNPAIFYQANLRFATVTSSAGVTGFSERMRLDSSGNLGIGTNSPANRLHVVGSGDISRFTNGSVTLYGYSDSGGMGWFTGAVATGTGVYYNNTSNFQALYTAGSERMRLDSSGNLGIGTNSPGAKLDVYGSSSTAEIRVRSTSTIPALSFYSESVQPATRNWAIAGSVNAYGDLCFQQSNALGGNPITAGTTRLTLDASGNLGLGVTPSAWRLVFNAMDAGRASLAGATGAAQFQLTANAFQNSAGNWIYRATDTAVRYEGSAGTHAWFTAPSGTVGNLISFTQAMTLDASGNLTVNTGALGYGTGSGGAVTQATSRTTGVTLNKSNGAITLVSAAGTASWQSFTVTNSAVAATDVVRVVQASGTDLYQIHVTAVAAGSFRITFATTGGTTTEQPVFNFAVLKAVTA